MCYQVKFGTYATKDVRITGKEPQKLGSAEIPSLVVGVWACGWPLVVRPSPRVIVWILSLYVKLYYRKEIRLKICFLSSSFSRSLIVIGTDTDRYNAYDSVLTIHSNRKPVSYRFWNDRQFHSKSQISTPHMYFAPTLMGFPGEIVDQRSGSKKIKMEWRGTGCREKSDVIFGRLDTTHERDRQIDGQTPYEIKECLRIASRGKNYKRHSSGP